MSDIVPASAEVLRVDQTGARAAKIRIEIKEPEQKFLVYSPTPQSPAETEWLYDIRRYSRTFTADSASLLLNRPLAKFRI